MVTFVEYFGSPGDCPIALRGGHEDIAWNFEQASRENPSYSVWIIPGTTCKELDDLGCQTPKVDKNGRIIK